MLNFIPAPPNLLKGSRIGRRVRLHRSLEMQRFHHLRMDMCDAWAVPVGSQVVADERNVSADTQTQVLARGSRHAPLTSLGLLDPLLKV